MSTKISKISVSLSPKEINIIEKTSKERGLYNNSAALRQIIGEWEEMKKSANHNHIKASQTINTSKTA